MLRSKIPLDASIASNGILLQVTPNSQLVNFLTASIPKNILLRNALDGAVFF